MTVQRREEILWESPKEVKIQQALWADVDNDGKEELVLLCWKKGRYGKSRPFWVERDEKKWSQHLFVYEYDQGVIRSKWMSSYLGIRGCKWGKGPAFPPLPDGPGGEGKLLEVGLLGVHKGGERSYLCGVWG